MKLLFALALSTLLAFTAGHPHNCTPCTSPSQCSSGACIDGTCAPDSDPTSLRKCFGPECHPCDSADNCETESCILGRCVNRTVESMERCFLTNSPSPAPTSTKLKECSPCTSASLCSTRFCNGWPRVCHKGTRASLRRCFKRECATCKVDGECASRRCEGGKCIFNDDRSRRRCGVAIPGAKSDSPPPTQPKKQNTGKNACEACVSASECSSGYCSSGLCGTPVRVGSCPGRECSPCSSNNMCAVGSCMKGRCSDGTEASLTRCGLSRDCGACRSGDDCATGRCIDSVCTDGSYEGLVRCGFVRECMPCSSSMPCATRRCGGGFCAQKGMVLSEARRKCAAKGYLTR